MMQKAVLFDMDGVILDSMPFHVRAWQDALAEQGVSVPEEVIYLHEGAIEPRTAIDIFEKNGCHLDEDGFKRLFLRQMAIFNARYRQMVHPYPGITTLLGQLLAGGLQMALVTSSHKEIVGNVLPEAQKKYVADAVSNLEMLDRKDVKELLGVLTKK